MGMAISRGFERIVVVEVRNEDDEVVSFVSLAGNDQAAALQPGYGGTNSLALLDAAQGVRVDEGLCPSFGADIDEPGRAARRHRTCVVAG